MDYLHEPVIRKHIFGWLQIFIGMGIGFYFMFTTDSILTVCLLGFMIWSFLLGDLNIGRAREVMAINAALAYIIYKHKENRTDYQEKYIKDFENSDTYKLLREAGIEI